MDYKVFRTRKEVQAEVAKMIGWDAAVELLVFQDHPLATKRWNVIVIACNGGQGKQYLREDGCVR